MIFITFLFTPILFMFVFGQFETSLSLFSRLSAYLNLYSLGDKVFQDYINGSLTHTYGEIYLSGFWRYVPRALFEAKPYAYGPTYLIEVYFPGMAATGHTPSFGYAYLFYDFGWLGFGLLLFSFNSLLSVYAAKILTSDRRKKIQLVMASYAIFPFYAFHVPLQLMLLVHLLMLKIKLPKVVFQSRTKQTTTRQIYGSRYLSEV